MLGTVLTPLITPFDCYDNISYNHLKRLIGHLQETKTDTIILYHPAGEGASLNALEKQVLLEKLMMWSLKPLRKIIYLTDYSYSTLSDQIHLLNRWPIHGYMLPISSKDLIHADGIVQTLKKLAQISHHPIIIEIDPKMSLNHLETILEACQNLQTISGAYVSETKQFELIKDRMPRLPIYVPIDASLLNYLKTGARGVLSPIHHIYGDTIHTLFQLVKNGLPEDADLLWDVYKDRLLALNQGHPVYMKAVLNYLGYAVGKPRLPLAPLKKEAQTQLINQLDL